MIELTAHQIVDGWIAHDRSGFPAALSDVGRGQWECMWQGGDVERYETLSPKQACGWSGGIVAYRILKLAAQAPTDPNAAMLAADERPAYDVPAMAGNGCIFGAPRVEHCNLLVVAPISATGFSVWGA